MGRSLSTATNLEASEADGMKPGETLCGLVAGVEGVVDLEEGMRADMEIAVSVKEKMQERQGMEYVVGSLAVFYILFYIPYYT